MAQYFGPAGIQFSAEEILEIKRLSYEAARPNMDIHAKCLLWIQFYGTDEQRCASMGKS